MIVLIAFAFLGGVVTVLSPCILPLLPIILSTSAEGSRARPFGIVTGFIVSFTFFTLFLSTLVGFLGIPADTLRTFSIIILFVFGLSLVIPKLQLVFEQAFAKFSGRFGGAQTRSGFWGGVIVGLSLGLLWTPCVGPILASVISLAIAGQVTWQAFVVTLAYSIGTALPMLAIMFTGRSLFVRFGLLSKTQKIQQFFGIVMVLMSLAIFFQIDRRFQVFVLDTFPNYGALLTGIEDNNQVRKSIEENQMLDQEGNENYNDNMENKILVSWQIIGVMGEGSGYRIWEDGKVENLVIDAQDEWQENSRLNNAQLEEVKVLLKDSGILGLPAVVDEGTTATDGQVADWQVGENKIHFKNWPSRDMQIVELQGKILDLISKGKKTSN